jgi:hypothetical protein
MPEVQFKTFIPELVNTMPIIRAGRHRYDWYELALKDITSAKPIHTAKCPGIISVNSTGWIQRAYQDFIIETNGDTVSFKWLARYDQKHMKHGNLMGDYISDHSQEQYYNYNPNLFNNTLKTIIKIQSPWCAVIPEGYSLLSMPIPYSDDHRFIAATGIIRKTQWLNVQLYWKCLESIELVKAGTPLQQYILIKDEKVDFINDVINESDLDYFNKV